MSSPAARRTISLLSVGGLLIGLGGTAAPAATDPITTSTTPTSTSTSTTLAGSAETPEPPEYAPPSVEEVSAETMRQVRLAEGEGSQVLPGTQRHVQIESPAHFEAAPYEVGQDVDLWIIAPEGENGQYFGSFEVTADEDPARYWSFLGPVTFPGEAFDYSGVYAAALTDQDGELLAWQRTVLELEGEEVTDSSPGGAATDTWPVPEGDGAEPVTEPPTLEDLTEEGYGRIYIQEDSPVIPLDRTFTAVFEDTTQLADYWLLPAEGSDAIWLPMQALSNQEVGEVHAELILSSEDVESTGIYALAAKNLSGSLIGWTPFGISADGESIQPGDPGVNAEDTNTDRSIFPIPDSVPVPNDKDNDDAGAGAEDDQAQSQTQSPDQSPGQGDSPSQEPAAGENSGVTEDAGAASGVGDTIGWMSALAVAGAAIVVVGLLYLISARRRSSG